MWYCFSDEDSDIFSPKRRLDPYSEDGGSDTDGKLKDIYQENYQYLAKDTAGCFSFLTHHLKDQDQEHYFTLKCVNYNTCPHFILLFEN